MEKLFRPGKWLVLFCGVFVLLWGVLQYVSNSRLKEEAEIIGASLFTWTWPGDDWSSRAEISSADVVSKTETGAVVKVTGKQTLNLSAGVTETADCAATLTFYKLSEKNKDYWVLGKVEFP